MKNQQNIAIVKPQSQNLTLSQFLAMPSPSKAIADALGERKHQFIASMVSLVKCDGRLEGCTKESLLSCGLTAASLDLPLHPSLGLAFAIPYRSKRGLEAQFQLGWKGFVQLAQRSGQIETINVTAVTDAQLVSENKLTGELTFDWSVESTETTGYVAYFRLLNGFNKTLYMSVKELKKHGQTYSKTFKTGHWYTNFDAMAKKTVIKQLISKWCPISTQLQKAIIFDQAVIRDGEPEYVDSLSISPYQAGKEANQAWEEEVKEILAKENK